MQPEPDKNLEQWLHRELRQLPDHRAPEALRARVSAAIAARERLPWWKKSFAQWPQGGRWLFLAVALLIVMGSVYGTFAMTQEVSLTSVQKSAGGWLVMFKPLSSLLAVIGNALWLVVKTVPTYFWWAMGGVITAAYLTCVGLGTLGYRLAFK